MSIFVQVQTITLTTDVHALFCYIRVYLKAFNMILYFNFIYKNSIKLK